MTEDFFRDKLLYAMSLDDHNTSNAILSELADAGYPDAALALALRHLNGEGFEPDPHTALPYFILALVKGGYWEDFASIWIINNAFSDVEREEAYRNLLKTAEEGNSGCLFFIGFLKENEFTLDAALPFYEKSAAAGNPEAMYRLGLYYEITQPELAVRLFQNAADGGCTAAACHYAKHCEESDPLADYEKAYTYYLMASELPNAQYRLGCFYENGLGTPRDPKKAVSCYLDYINTDFDEPVSHIPLDPTEEEKDKFLSSAYLSLGKLLLHVRTKDRPYFAPTPLQCFEQASLCAQEDEEKQEALFQLGRVHFFGLETKVDLDLGVSYLEEAAACGSIPAADLLHTKDTWDQIDESLCQTEIADEASRREEALLRLEILEQKGVFSQVKKAFADKGIPGYACDDCYGFRSFDETASADFCKTQNAVKEFERRRNTVYFIHSSLTLSYGLLQSFFYVSSRPSEWIQERRDLLLEHPIAAVANISEGYTEVGEIGYTIEDDLMQRRY